MTLSAPPPEKKSANATKTSKEVPRPRCGSLRRKKESEADKAFGVKNELLAYSKDRLLLSCGSSLLPNHDIVASSRLHHPTLPSVPYSNPNDIRVLNTPECSRLAAITMWAIEARYP